MKLIKTRFGSRIGEKSLSNLMKITIESPPQLTDDDLAEIWKRQPRKVPVQIRVTVCYYVFSFKRKFQKQNLYIMHTDFPFVKLINSQISRGQRFFKGGKVPPLL